MEEYILQDQLARYAPRLYPLHMPGHKRRMAPAPDLPYTWDLTEVEGVDDLHEAEGILAQAMARTATLWGADRSWYLVNGSTCGILAAIHAAVPFGGSLLCARNCHKSVYHAIQLGHLHPHWLLPPVDPDFGIYGSLPPQAVARALDAHPEASCLVLTSPTYEGVLSDLKAIADLCHARNIPLIVDEAHGAHYLPLAAPWGWRGGAVAAGADLVIQSPHKTLPSLTQTALLHLNGDRIDPAAVEQALDLFETSSPSYPLMASLDGCTGILAHRGESLFAAWRQRLDRFSAAVRPLQGLRVFCHGTDRPENHPTVFAQDPGKLLVSGRGAGYTGAGLAKLLRERFGFETEMSCGENLLAMTSICDEETALDRFAAALLALDRRAGSIPSAPALPEPGEAKMTIAQALAAPGEAVAWEDAAGRVAAEYLWAYPPGVPLIVPGEVLEPAMLAACRGLEAAGTRLRRSRGGAAGVFVVRG